MPSLVDALMAGSGLGFTVAFPIGPMALLCIQRSLRQGFGAGLATGLGAASLHACASLVALTGFDAVARVWLEKETRLFCALAALAFLWCAIAALRRPISLTFGVGREAAGLLRLYAGALAIGAVNPMTFLLFAAAAPILMKSVPAGQTSAAALGVFLGSAGWWLILTGFTTLVRRRVRASSLAVCNAVAAVMLGGLAAALLGKALGW